MSVEIHIVDAFTLGKPGIVHVTLTKNDEGFVAAQVGWYAVESASIFYQCDA